MLRLRFEFNHIDRNVSPYVRLLEDNQVLSISGTPVRSHCVMDLGRSVGFERHIAHGGNASTLVFWLKEY